MPTVHVHLQTPLRRSFRVAQIAGMFDLPLNHRLEHAVRANVPAIDEPWSIGAIVGPSASGKTTLAQAAFPAATCERKTWPADRALIDVLDEAAVHAGGQRRTIKELTRVLIGVGLGSVPTWLKPYTVLSAGEQVRAELARSLLTGGDVIVHDEFTSALNRTVAQTTSAAVARLVRSKRLNLPRLVVVTGHDDVLPWLAPDWIVSLSDNQRPQLSWPTWSPPHLALAVRRVPQSL
jgi:ABC-type ATPase with predicted acetyltransferase domain